MELANRDALESSFSARFARLNSRLRHKLDDYLGSPPNPSNVPESFWQEVQDEANRELSIVLLLLWSQSAVQHGLGSSLADAQGLQYARDRAATLSRDYTANTRAGLETAARRWTPDVARGAVDEDLVGILGPNRAARVAVTETTKAQTAGGEAGIGQTVGLSGEDIWRTTPPNVCPICQRMNGQPRSVWQLEFPTGPGDDVHPYCKCFIRYAMVAGAI